MEFENLLIQITEIFHQSINAYKEEIIKKSKFSDITVSQLFYMEAVYHLGNPTLSELAAHLKISKASTTVGVQKLIEKGLVAKARSEADQRVFHVRLSGRGRQLIEAEVNALADFAERIKHSLSKEEIKRLSRIFKKIVEDYHR